MSELPLILFCSHPLRPAAADPTFEGEVAAARAAGFDTQTFGLEALLAGEAGRALARLPPADAPRPLIYRGWMLRDVDYARLHGALAAKGYEPVTSPAAYDEAHYLPFAYPLLEAETAPTAWSYGDDLDAAWRAARSLGPGPLVVKDFVKSAKHRWREACFLPDASDRPAFDAVCSALRADRGERFEKGFVFRRYLPLRERGTSMLGAPLHDELRLFFFRGGLLPLPVYDDAPGGRAQFERFGAIARRFQSPFLTIDVALADDEHWLVVESGDGGVSGIPPAIDDASFYAALGEAAGR
jgi:ATP-grasp domain-containing protein